MNQNLAALLALAFDALPPTQRHTPEAEKLDHKIENLRLQLKEMQKN